MFQLYSWLITPLVLVLTFYPSWSCGSRADPFFGFVKAWPLRIYVFLQFFKEGIFGFWNFLSGVIDSKFLLILFLKISFSFLSFCFSQILQLVAFVSIVSVFRECHWKFVLRMECIQVFLTFWEYDNEKFVLSMERIWSLLRSTFFHQAQVVCIFLMTKSMIEMNKRVQDIAITVLKTLT